MFGGISPGPAPECAHKQTTNANHQNNGDQAHHEHLSNTSKGTPLSPTSKLLCIFGTASDVGKSWVTAGLCRLFANDGIKVAPYKAQNLSNNAGVTLDALEMGRAQMVQAHACRLVPHVDMNPLLLKPNTDIGAQVVALGKVLGPLSAAEYFRGGDAADRRRALVTDALDRLRSRYDLIVAEGAGSCAEVNLRSRDLVNMPIAHHGNGRVLIVADIDKGGVFAQCVGTLACMPEHDRARVAGFLINRFRGDPTLFEDGVAWLQQQTGRPVLGVIPWNPHIQIELEDGLAPDTVVDGPQPDRPDRFHAAVLRVPHISNFTDFDALERHGVQVHYLARPRDLSAYDLVLLPGSKNTAGDLRWLRAQGWDRLLLDRARSGGAIGGICGGFQMLGRSLHDPHGIETDLSVDADTVSGLGLLPVDTVMGREKTTRPVTGHLGGVPVHGYEIHVGQTHVDGSPLLLLDDPETGPRPDGVRQGSVFGTYVHGIFDAPGAVAALLGPIRPDLPWSDGPTHESWRDQQLDALAEHLRKNVDVEQLYKLAGVHRPRA